MELKEVQLSASSEPSPVSFSYPCEEGKSAFEVLSTNAKIEADDSSLGKMVTSINGREAGGGKFWLYSISDVEATMGASAYICQGKEMIKWELR